MDSRGYSPIPEPMVEDTEGLLRSGLKVSHLRMIVALEDSGQVSAAAHMLNITQPGASRMIAEMEDMLGVPLCRRLPRGVELTPYGATLARRARTMLLELREIDREIGDLKSGKGGAVFMGAVTAPAIGLAVPAIQRMRASFPRVEISVYPIFANCWAIGMMPSLSRSATETGL
jgi:DNA-binding transcriptional LysR family regulator